MTQNAIEVVRHIATSVIPECTCTDMERVEHSVRTWRVSGKTESSGRIIKLFRSHSESQKCETSALRRLRDIGKAFPVPQLLWSGALPVFGVDFIVMTELRGCTLHRAVSRRLCDRKAALCTVGQLLAKLHSATKASPGLSDPSQKVLKVCEDQIRLLRTYGEYEVARLSKEARRRIASMAYPLRQCVICHGDLHLRNIIVTPGYRRMTVSGIVDFELARTAAPEFDIAKSIVVTSNGEDNNEGLIISRYNACQLSTELLDAFKMFHVIDGWLYARIIERRDRNLWDRRLRTVVSQLRY